MNSKLLLSVIIFSIGTLAFDTQSSPDAAGGVISNPSIASSTDGTEKAAANDVINELTAKSEFLYTSQKVRFVKNPCEGKKGYRFRALRGFGFENGVVKKFQANGQISYEKANYTSLGDFFQKRRLCQPINKKLPALNLGIESLEIW